MITSFSVIWGILNCSLLIMTIYLLQKNLSFLTQVGSTFLIFLTICCVLRMAVPFENPDFQYLINSDKIYAAICYPYIILGHHVPIDKIMIAIWAAGALYFVLRMVIRLKKTIKYLKKTGTVPPETYRDVLRKVDTKDEFQISISSYISGPVLLGLNHPIIYLPHTEYTEDELYYICLHEYIHWKNKDGWIKIGMNLLCAIFWWFIPVYFFRKVVSQTLELRCDETLSKKLSDKELLEYLNTLLTELKSSVKKRENENFVAFVNPFRYSASKQRFQYLLQQKPSKKKRRLCHIILTCILGVWFVASYYFILQPAYWDIPVDNDLDESTIYLDEDDLYLVKQEDGSYLLYGFGSPERVSEEEVKAGYYDIYPIKERK